MKINRNVLLGSLLFAGSASVTAADCMSDAKMKTLNKIKEGWFSVPLQQRSEKKFKISDIKMAATTSYDGRTKKIEKTRVVFSYLISNNADSSMSTPISVVGYSTYDSLCKSDDQEWSAQEVFQVK